MKKFISIGGIVGAVIGILISIYFASQNLCVGLYLDHIDKNGVPVTGTVCPKLDVLANLQSSIIIESIAVILLVLIGMFVGWIVGKIINKRHGRVTN